MGRFISFAFCAVLFGQNVFAADVLAVPRRPAAGTDYLSVIRDRCPSCFAAISDLNKVLSRKCGIESNPEIQRELALNDPAYNRMYQMLAMAGVNSSSQLNETDKAAYFKYANSVDCARYR